MDWSVRVLHEMGRFERSIFVTLTYAQDFLPSDGSLDKRELSLFIKRLRKKVRPRLLKYLGCGEYGETYGRPHYHLIVLGLGMADTKAIAECWSFGFVDVKPATFGRVKYVVGYVMKKAIGKNAKEVYGNKEPPFLASSKGMGAEYVRENFGRLVKDQKFTVNGVDRGLPRYYRKVIKKSLPQKNFGLKARKKIEEQKRELMERNGLESWEARAMMRDHDEQRARELEAKIELSRREN